MKEPYQYTIIAFVTSLGVTPFNTTYDRAKMEKKSAATRIQTHALQETIYSVTEHFHHRSLKIRHKNLSVTISDSVMY